MTGNNITTAGEQLTKVQIDYLVNSIKNPRAEIEAKIRQLRIIYSLDKKHYNDIKKSLPYFVCGIFSPPYRKKEYFAYTEYFILDIDGFSEKGMSMEDARRRIEQDEQTTICFSSPSEDGLKVMFKLSERCYDPVLYSIFYKEFARQFSEKHHLEQVIDRITNDVTRACFISSDKGIFYRDNPVPVDLHSYIDENNASELSDIIYRQGKETIGSKNEEVSVSQEPNEEILDRIRTRLGARQKKPKEAKDVYVPQEVLALMSGLKDFVESTGISMTDEINIQYGKKLRFSAGPKNAEINIFYGKRGYSVVQTPRCGTNIEFNQLMAELINSYIQDNTR